MEDKQFTTLFAAVLAALVAFTVIILIIANVLTSADNYADDPMMQQEIAERIKPVGEVYVGSVPASAGGGAQVVASAEEQGAAMSGEQVYQQACAACHAAGVLNAPKLGDSAAWSTRKAKGMDTLYTNAINGIGSMPAKGGRADIADDQIKAAVDYLLAN